MKVGKDYYFHLYVSNRVVNHGLNITKTLGSLKKKKDYTRKYANFMFLDASSHSDS